MSGIVGIDRLDNEPADRAVLDQMVDSLAHRGPDGRGAWHRGGVGLGHRMLWTTPESLRERLPLERPELGLAMTADARLDNRESLIAMLGGPERFPPGVGDADLILAAYEAWGERCPEKLLGDFAFAIWDGRRRLLLCARDHMGVKPFYYHHSDRLFAFASEIKALLRIPEMPRRLNEVRVGDYLVPMLEDKAHTFYEGILRLPPAHALTVQPGRLRSWQYWSLDPTKERRGRSDAEHAEELRAVFTEAVRCRLRSAFPVGAMLSGGLDSSSIVCTARGLISRKGASRLKTFSAVFAELPRCDERLFIQAVLSQGDLEPHYVLGDQLSPLVDLESVLFHQDEAFCAPNLFLHWGLYRAAHGQGARVMLDGLDGDTTVSHGIGYLGELARAGRWWTLGAEILGLSRCFDRSRWGIFLFHAVKPLTPERLWQTGRWLRGRGHSAQGLPSIIGRDFARRTGLAQRVRALRRRGERALRTERACHHRALTHGQIPYALEIADKAAAAFSLEPRYPFFDRRLVELCLSLPAEQKLSGGYTRVVMRRAMQGVLPPQVQWRGGKADLSPSFVHGLLAHRDRVHDPLRWICEDATSLGDFFDFVALREAYDRYSQKGSNGDALAIWRAVVLATWLRQSGLSRTANQRLDVGRVSA